MQPIKAVIFDLDDTLYTMAGVHDLALEAMSRYAQKMFGLSAEQFQSAFSLAQTQCMQEMPKNATSHSRLIWAHRFCENNGYNPFLHACSMESAYWDTFFSRIALKPGAAQLLDALKAHGIRTALCTDMQMHIQHRKVQILDLQNRLDVMVCSDAAGFDKPHPRIYRQTLERLGCTPQEAVMVGDSLKKDVLGPLSVGIRGIWFNDLHADETGITVPVVHSHAQLRTLLEGPAFNLKLTD